MFTLNCNGRLLVVDKPLVMGIINATPDSFYAGSRQQTVDKILSQAETMLNQGADILDIGGQSTRPGSEQVSEIDELTRVLPGISAIHQRFPGTFISVDTFYAKVAGEAVAAGAAIVNDISAGNLDPAMLETIAALKVPYVLMHMKGTPRTMQNEATYEDVTRDVLDFFIRKTAELRALGLNDIIVDPGFGFGKTIAHNFQMIRNLSVFQMLGYPLMIGLSRKSTIFKTLGITPEASLNGTTVLNTLALSNGANIIRVHDVKEAKEAAVLVQACVGSR